MNIILVISSVSLFSGSSSGAEGATGGSAGHDVDMARLQGVYLSPFQCPSPSPHFSLPFCITAMLYISVLQSCYISLCITVMFYLSLYYSHVISLCITIMLYLSVLQSCYTSLCITAMLEARGVPPHMFGSLESNMRNIIQRSMCSSAMNKVTSLIKGMQTKDDEGQQLSSVMEMCQVGLHLVFHILQFNIL